MSGVVSKDLESNLDLYEPAAGLGLKFFRLHKRTDNCVGCYYYRAPFTRYIKRGIYRGNVSSANYGFNGSINLYRSEGRPARGKRQP